MRTFDLAPFYRSTIGFDRLFSLLDQVTGDAAPGYPPYNIERTGENDYRISVAVSAFRARASIVATDNTLTIRAKAGSRMQDKSELFIAASPRALNGCSSTDHVQVKGATLENNLLHVDLVRDSGS